MYERNKARPRIAAEVHPTSDISDVGKVNVVTMAAKPFKTPPAVFSISTPTRSVLLLACPLSLVLFNAAILGHSGDVAAVGARLDIGVMPMSVLCRRRYCADVDGVLLSESC